MVAQLFIDQGPVLKGRTPYDVIVERWNALKRHERQARTAECKAKGHDWEPLSWGPDVCRRCMQYASEN